MWPCNQLLDSLGQCKYLFHLATRCHHSLRCKDARRCQKRLHFGQLQTELTYFSFSTTDHIVAAWFSRDVDIIWIHTISSCCVMGDHLEASNRWAKFFRRMVRQAQRQTDRSHKLYCLNHKPWYNKGCLTLFTINIHIYIYISINKGCLTLFERLFLGVSPLAGSPTIPMTVLLIWRRFRTWLRDFMAHHRSRGTSIPVEKWSKVWQSPFSIDGRNILNRGIDGIEGCAKHIFNFSTVHRRCFFQGTAQIDPNCICLLWYSSEEAVTQIREMEEKRCCRQ